MDKQRRKIDKIYSQVDKIASKGKDNFLEYYLLVDDLVKSSDYDILLQSLYYHYDINIVKLNSIEDVKKKTWKDIMYATKGPLTKKLKKLYDIKKVYQISFDIIDSLTNIKLGTIVEIDAYTDESKYLIKNKMFAKITKSRKVILEVTKVGELTPTILDTYDFSVSDDQNMYNKYVTAINLLTS